MINVPQFEFLAVDDILEFAMKDSEFPKYMPDSMRELKKFPRSYIANCVNTILPDKKFQKWVMNRITARNTKVAVQNNLNV